MENLALRRAEIVERHQQRLIQANREILELMRKALTEKDKKAGGSFAGFIDSLKLDVYFDSNSKLGMTGEQKLEFARLWFQHAEKMRETIVNDPGYSSVLQDIDRQMEYYRSELKRIDEEMKNIEDEIKRNEMEEQIREYGVRAEPER